MSATTPGIEFDPVSQAAISMRRAYARSAELNARR